MGKKSKRRGRGRSQRPPPPLPQPQQQQAEETEAVTTITRAVVDRLIERFHLASSLYEHDPWNADRLATFFLYSHICLLNAAKKENKIELGTEKDWQLIKKVSRSRTKPVFLRAEALWLTGWTIYTTKHKYEWDNAQDFYDKTLEVCRSVSDEEKERTVVLMDRPWKVGDYLNHIQKKCKKFQYMHEHFAFGAWGDDGEPKTVRIVGGLECDCCGKDREELGLNTLQVCSFCKMAYYCSRECQLKAWSEGHKTLCRKEGEFKAGDAAYITESVDMVRVGDEMEMSVNEQGDEIWIPEIIGTFTAGTLVWVLGTLVSEPNSMIIQSQDEDEENGIGIVPVEILRRCRPALWQQWTQKDIDFVRDQLIAARDAEARSSSGVEEDEETGEEILPVLVHRHESEEADEE